MSTLLSSHQNNVRLEKVKNSIHGLLSQKLSLNEDSVPEYLTNDYRIGTYKNFGQGRYSYELARDLLKFREECRKLDKPCLSFWAVFEESDDLSEAEFEACLLKELSSATVHSELTSKWDPNFSSDSQEKSLHFNLDGTAFSVVGVHPHGSQSFKRFAHPTLIFTIDDERCAQAEASEDTSKNSEGKSRELVNVLAPTSALQPEFNLGNSLISLGEESNDDSERFLQISSQPSPSFWSFDLRRTQTNVLPF